MLYAVIPTATTTHNPKMRSCTAKETGFSASSPAGTGRGFPSGPTGGFPCIPACAPPGVIAPAAVPAIIGAPIPLFFLLSSISSGLSEHPTQLKYSASFASARFMLFATCMPSNCWSGTTLTLSSLVKSFESPLKSAPKPMRKILSIGVSEFLD